MMLQALTRLVTFVPEAHSKNKPTRQLVSMQLWVTMSQERVAVKKQHARPVHSNHRQAKHPAKIAQPVSINRPQAKHLAKIAQPVCINRPQVKRHVSIAQPVSIKIMPDRFHVKIVSKDIVQKARLNRCHVLPVIILHKDVQIVSPVPLADSNRGRGEWNATTVQPKQFEKCPWVSIKTKQGKLHAKHALAPYR